eukprot:GFUD01111089.1.p1 GENE.GFUD01111089.1~~GFUD01111089.1.p1  ORF type:complete len:578 (+),score=143.83 GFUD01111089.1:34-1767(+)
MASCSSDRLERVTSGPSVYNVVPENKLFQFELLSLRGKLLDEFEYVLKKGKILPYSVVLRGHDVIFSGELSPNIKGFEDGVQEDHKWVFEQNFASVVFGSTSSPEPLVNRRPATIRSVDDIACSPTETTRGATQTTSISAEENLSVSRSSTSDSEENLADPEDGEPSGVTQHTQPNWLEELKGNFHVQIIELCSARTRRAVELNEKIKEQKQFNAVKNELINTVITHLKTIFRLHALPTMKEMRELAYTLSYTYPFMFQYTGEVEGLFGPEKVDILASKMKERMRGQLRQSQKLSGNEEDGEEQPPTKKGKTKIPYGLDGSKWSRAKKAKPEAAVALSSTNAETEFEKREAVFEEHRDELTGEFKSCKRSIANTCKGFFLDWRHVAAHFSYLAESSSLTGKVEQNLKTQFDNLEIFLQDQVKTVEFREEFEKIEQVCQVEHNGSYTLKFIHLLRFSCMHFDGGTGAELVRVESDGPPKTASPHIFAIEVNKGLFVFEVWVESHKILGNLNISTAISSFLHLCFVFHLKYPKEGETTADLLQRGFAKYGDSTGTRTWKKAATAAKKLEVYYSTVGRLL